jgi:cell wall-associated NlpC family hydrolase
MAAAVVCLSGSASLCAASPLDDDSDARASIAERTANIGSDIVFRALALLGVPYHYGGDDALHGFDCSGLVRRVFADLLNWDLPHRSDQLVREGRPVAVSELEAGDLLFFNTRRHPFSHVAIYIGDGRFVHAPGRGTMVRIDGLDEPYWQHHFNGARRLLSAPAADGTVAAPVLAATTAPRPKAKK